jgi:radical SAM protein with 4Fe4S-binding SPASM domain
MNPRSTDAASIDWTLGFRARAHRERIPVSATLELTQRCNLRCRHCYLGDQDAQHARGSQERTTAAVQDSLREWAQAGCLYLLITGGDPMIRPDFPEIYRTACELGLVVTVFCDGLLVDDAIIALFREYPPRKVEVSIYGATPAVYDRVTRVSGSYVRAWSGIDRLCESGIRVGLKTMLLSLNEHELDAMEAQASERGLSFRYDSAVSPCLATGAQMPLDLRVSPERVIEHDFATPARRKQWLERYEQMAGQKVGDRLYPCGAGATGFCADPFGALAPCLMTTRYAVSPDGRPFSQVWGEELGHIQDLKRGRDDSCLAGKLRGACVHCPAMNYLETGDEEEESEYTEIIANLRYQSIRHLQAAGEGVT